MLFCVCVCFFPACWINKMLTFPDGSTLGEHTPIHFHHPPHLHLFFLPVARKRRGFSFLFLSLRDQLPASSSFVYDPFVDRRYDEDEMMMMKKKVIRLKVFPSHMMAKMKSFGQFP